MSLGRLIFLGDESRRRIVCKLLNLSPPELDAKKNFAIKRGKVRMNRTESGDKTIIETYFLPPGAEIFLPAKVDESTIKSGPFDRGVIFESSPFGKESTEEISRLIDKTGKFLPEVLFVLANLDGKASEELNRRESFLLKKEREVFVINSEKQILQMLTYRFPLATGTIRRLRRELGTIRMNAEDFFDACELHLETEERAGCLSEAAKSRGVSFASVKGKSNVWVGYRDAMARVLFPQTAGGLNGLIEIYIDALYKTSTGKSLAEFFWNPGDDRKRLAFLLQKSLTEAVIAPKKYQGFNAGEFGSEKTYNTLIGANGKFFGITDAFFEAYEKFVRRVAPEKLFSDLEARIWKLGKQLNEIHE